MTTVRNHKLSFEEGRELACVINCYGDGEICHPEADDLTIGNFGTAYAIDCLELACVEDAELAAPNNLHAILAKLKVPSDSVSVP